MSSDEVAEAIPAHLQGRAAPVFARIVGGVIAWRASLVAAAGVVVSSASNILGGWAGMGLGFLRFVFGTALLLLGLLALAGTIALSARGAGRLIAFVPVGVIAGVALNVVAGSPIVLVTWLTASVDALWARPPEGLPAVS